MHLVTVEIGPVGVSTYAALPSWYYRKRAWFLSAGQYPSGYRVTILGLEMIFRHSIP